MHVIIAFGINAAQLLLADNERSAPIGINNNNSTLAR